MLWFNGYEKHAETIFLHIEVNGNYEMKYWYHTYLGDSLRMLEEK
jgi:hypothetical protein